ASAFSELLKSHSAETIRFFLLATHYRRPIDFSEERIQEVHTGLEQFYRFFKRYERVTGQSFYSLTPPATRAEGDAILHKSAAHGPTGARIAELRSSYLEAMDDDFNTGGAVGDLFE